MLPVWECRIVCYMFECANHSLNEKKKHDNTTQVPFTIVNRNSHTWFGIFHASHHRVRGSTRQLRERTVRTLKWARIRPCCVNFLIPFIVYSARVARFVWHTNRSHRTVIGILSSKLRQASLSFKVVSPLIVCCTLDTRIAKQEADQDHFLFTTLEFLCSLGIAVIMNGMIVCDHENRRM